MDGGFPEVNPVFLHFSLTEVTTRPSLQWETGLILWWRPVRSSWLSFSSSVCEAGQTFSCQPWRQLIWVIFEIKICSVQFFCASYLWPKFFCWVCSSQCHFRPLSLQDPLLVLCSVLVHVYTVRFRRGASSIRTDSAHVLWPLPHSQEAAEHQLLNQTDVLNSSLFVYNL